MAEGDSTGLCRLMTQNLEAWSFLKTDKRKKKRKRMALKGSTYIYIVKIWDKNDLFKLPQSWTLLALCP